MEHRFEEVLDQRPRAVNTAVVLPRPLRPLPLSKRWYAGLILSRVKLASGNGSGGEGEAVFIQRALRDLLASLSTWSPLGY